MRIGLISDTHIPEAMPELWPHVFEVFDGCEAILHAGDIYDISVIEGLSAVAPTYAARGNGDDGSSGRGLQPDDERLRPSWVLEHHGLRIGLTHHLPIPEQRNYKVVHAIERHFDGETLDVIVYGDTHVEHITTIDGVLCVNPGSATFPHNLVAQLGTVGFLELADGGVEASIWRLTEAGVEPFDWETWGRPW
ncbi:MAG: YfcE family phosphodiesterase [Actinomycetia bacterium]|nr:YfcE family phosphodiesterase [Actinomycetes bacterium]MCP4228338.1 YfcE family phosphodiesterase [Actinomycetes bacterium]MCP5031248.1 YfcE family phosphodiesterase [Actinomycetes bacterium]